MKKTLITFIILINTVFCQSGQYLGSSLYADIKAHNIGDLITVLIVETSNASRESKVSSESQAGMNLDGGVSGTLNSFLPVFGASSKMERSVDGSEGTAQKDQLTGKISATIVEELESGMFRIEGKRIVSVNGEKNTIEIDGFVRSRDINTDNTVYSFNVANANIVYRKGGVGQKLIKPRKLQGFVTWAIGLGLVAVSFMGGI